jgi:hypothetical protein
VDSMGRFCYVLAADNNAGTDTYFAVSVYDQTNTIVNALMQLDIQAAAAPTLVHMFVTPYTFHVDALNGTTWEYVRGGIIDVSPITSSPYANYTYVCAYRTAANAATNLPCDAFYMGDTKTHRTVNQIAPGPAVTVANQAADGSILVQPVTMALYLSSTWRIAGRLFEHYWVPNFLQTGTQIVLPIGPGAVGTFQVISPAAAATVGYNFIQAVRVS